MIKLPPIVDYREAEKHVISPKNKEWFAQGANWMRAEVQRLNATAQTVSDRWRMVPNEPTQEMIWAAKNALSSTVGWESFKQAYYAMLAAAPGGQDDE